MWNESRNGDAFTVLAVTEYATSFDIHLRLPLMFAVSVATSAANLIIDLHLAFWCCINDNLLGSPV